VRSEAQDLVATCSVQTLHPLVTTLDRLRVDVDSVLGEASLTRAQLSQPFLRIPTVASREVWASAARHCKDPALGLRVVEDLDVQRFSLFTYLSATSATPRDAHERATRYVRIAHDGIDIRLEVEGDRTICCSSVAGAPRNPTEAEFAVGMMFRLAPLVVGESIGTELEAWFRHPAPSYAEQYEAVLGCPVHFEQRADALVGASAHLDDPLPKADSTLCALIEAHAAELLAKVPETGTFADDVRQRIAAALPDGDPSAEGVAEALGMSARTLRRRLRECDASHQRLLDEVRHGIARTALAEPGISVNEVAYLLGFSDASAFTKAFKRWTGRSPGETLRELRGR
jgi:AraC-like DNA-binding protein